MKILICDKTEKDAIESMRQAGLEVDVRDTITPEELEQVISEYDAMVVRSRTKVRAPLMDKASRLKLIVRGGVGVDNIDADYAQTKGILVMNTPAASSVSVAELAVGMMFALARQIPQATSSMRAGQWEKKKFEGTEITGKTLGIVGIGRIGLEVAKRARALGMNVVAYDPYVTDVDLRLLPLDELRQVSAYITFHLPHTDETHHMISTDQFGMMKKGVFIIDCARGGVVDEDALYEAIVSGQVAGAAMDVFEEEPVYGHRLFSLDQVIGSPHIGAATREAQGRIGAEVADKLIEYARQNS
jgi:D-3-phosphoglycerate dehydrogenase / 2-oxoglutarate reductase